MEKKTLFGGLKANVDYIAASFIRRASDVEEIRKPENVISLLNVDPILLIFGYGLIPPYTKEALEDYYLYTFYSL